MEHADGQVQKADQPFKALQEALGAQYALERELGRGGMATVYLARDLRHGRAVAVKVLHAELAAVIGATRFLAEIRTTAALQHPHILPLFDSGEAVGQLYYVMPYVQGDTLRARLARERQLPIADAVRIASEVASALDYAHRQGVVHRDMKPENVLLGDGGQALVADFGIALAVSHAGGARITQTGLSLGTPQYMAPEQATAEPTVDARADVYALGTVTYEMIAGDPPFTGPSTQAVIARLLTEEPRSLTTLRRSVPQHVDAAVRTALEKLPADRFATAAAFADAIAGRVEVVRTREALGAMPSTRRRALTRVGGALGIAAIALLAWALGRRSTFPSQERRPVRFTIEPDSGILRIGAPTISPDGRTVVYAAESEPGTQLYARDLAETTARPLAGTDNADAPFFSPDGQWIAFYANGALHKVPLAGGGSVVITPISMAAFFDGGAWSDDDVIHFAAGSALYRVPASGGSATRVSLADSTLMPLAPHPLPGTRDLLVTLARGSAANAADIGVVDLASGQVRRVGPGLGARYVGESLVYAGIGGELYRRPFSLARRTPTGDAEQIATRILPSSGRYSFDVSSTGVLVYRVGRGRFSFGPDSRLSLLDSTGRVERVLPARVPWEPRFSPDGRRLAHGAYAPGRDSADVWITNLEDGTSDRMTIDGNDANDPVWSPDGRWIAYDQQAPGGKDVYVRAVHGGTERVLLRHPGVQWPTDWTRDGSALLITSAPRRGEFDILVAPVNGGTVRPYLATRASETAARISPDGRWVAYQSDETGRFEVYVQSFPTPGRRTLVSAGGGVNPMWRSNGSSIYYWKVDQLVEARVQESGSDSPLAVSARIARFRAPYVENMIANYDVAPGGARFAVVTGESRRGHIVVALDALSPDSRKVEADR